MATINSITLGGYPVHDAPDNCGEVNFFYTHTGASRIGRGVFLMQRSDYASLSYNTQTAVLKMEGDPGPGLTITVVLAGCETFTATSAAAPGDLPSDMVKVIVLDQRCLKFKPAFGVGGDYNVMSQPWAWDATGMTAHPACYRRTMFGTTTRVPYTWAQIQTLIEGCPVLPAPPAWLAYNFIWDDMPLARVVDDFLARLYYVVGWNLTSNQWTCNVPGVLTSDNSTTFNKAKQEAFIGGGQAERNELRVVGRFVVSFKTIDLDNPGDLYPIAGATKTYTKSVTVNAANALNTQPLACGLSYGFWQNGAWLNSGTLDTIAADIAARAYAAMAVSPSEWNFAGIWPFNPDGAIRGIKWISDKRGARTVLRLNNDRDFVPMDDVRRVLEAWSNSLIVGDGNMDVDFDMGSGTRRVRYNPFPPVEWIKLTSAMPPASMGANSGGGGFYNARKMTGQAETIDPTTDLVMPFSPNEAVSSTDDLLAENALEANFGDPASHVMPLPSFVPAWYVGMSNETPPRPTYRFAVLPPGFALCQVKATSGNGQYTGRMFYGRATATTGGASVMPQGLSDPGVDNALIINADESSLAGNRLKINSWVLGNIFGPTNDVPPLYIVITHGGVGRINSPKILPHGTFGAPDATTWNRDTDGKPVQFDPFWIGIDAGGAQFFMMIRTALYDARGMIYSVSAEVQTLITGLDCAGVP